MMVQKPKVINEKSHFGMLFKNICTMKIGNLTILIVKYNYNNDLWKYFSFWISKTDVSKIQNTEI